MTWQVQFLEAAQKDFERLDGSQKQETAKAICKVSQSKRGRLRQAIGRTHRHESRRSIKKIKLKRSGIRIVYKLVQDRDHMLIIVIGLRSDSAVYKTAAHRTAALDEDALS